MALPKRLSGKVVQQQIINYYKVRNTFLHSLKCFSALRVSSAPYLKAEDTYRHYRYKVMEALEKYRKLFSLVFRVFLASILLYSLVSSVQSRYQVPYVVLHAWKLSVFLLLFM
jgi:hypothetical protein